MAGDPMKKTAAGSAGSSDRGRQKPLGQLLKEMELITEGQIQEALSQDRKSVV